MKKLLSFAAVLAVCSMIFLSCGSDDSKKLEPKDQFQKAVTKTFVDNAKLVSHGLSQEGDTINLSNFGEELVIGIELGDPFQKLANAILSDNYLELNTQWLQSVQVAVKAGLTDKAVQFNVIPGLNKTDIFSVNVYEDSTNSMVYFSIPELIKNNFKISEKDFGISAREIMDTYLTQVSFMGSVPEETVFNGFIEEVVKAFVSPIDEVSRATETIKGGFGNDKSVSAQYTVLTTTFDEEKGEDLAVAVQDIIMKSSNFNAIANWIVPVISKMSGDKIRVRDFTEEVAEIAADFLEDLFAYQDVTVSLYVDSKSTIAGILLNIDDAVVILSAMPQKGNNFGYTFAAAEYDEGLTIENINATSFVSLNGYGTYAGGKMTGDFKAFYQGDEVLSFETKDLDITSLKSVKGNGSVTIHPKSDIREMAKEFLEDELDMESAWLTFADTLDLTINMAQKDYNSASLELVFTTGNTKMLAISEKYSITKPSEIKMPATDIMELNEDSIMDYEQILKGISTSTIVANLKKAKVAPEYIEPLESITGETLGSLADGLLGGYGGFDFDDFDW